MLSAALLYSQAAEEEAKPKEGEIKIYKRLIPADVLRGEFSRIKDWWKVNIRVMSELGIKLLPVWEKLTESVS